LIIEFLPPKVEIALWGFDAKKRKNYAFWRGYSLSFELAFLFV